MLLSSSYFERISSVSPIFKIPKSPLGLTCRPRPSSACVLMGVLPFRQRRPACTPVSSLYMYLLVICPQIEEGAGDYSLVRPGFHSAQHSNAVMPRLLRGGKPNGKVACW